MVNAVDVYSNGSYVLNTATFDVYLMDVAMVVWSVYLTLHSSYDGRGNVWYVRRMFVTQQRFIST